VSCNGTKKRQKRSYENHCVRWNVFAATVSCLMYFCGGGKTKICRVVQHSFAATGIVLSVFGLLYGGFWRIRMRERYNLPQTNWCCGCPGVTNCAQWLFCAPCSLCQEVRTAEAYEIKDDKFYTKKTSGNNTPGTSPEHLSGHHRIDVDMLVPSSSIQPLPISSMVHIKEMELALSERMPADGTMFFPPPPQNLTHYPS
jgi:Cys-rich protein (TIGR01571 family)